MIELPPPMRAGHFYDRREMVRLVRPHGAHDCDVVDNTAHVWEPIGHRNSRLAIFRKSPAARDHRPLPLSQVIPESNGVNHFARKLVVFGIEGVDMADPTAHIEQDYRLRLGRKRSCDALRHFAVLRPKRTNGGSKQSEPVQSVASRYLAAGKFSVHRKTRRG